MPPEHICDINDYIAPDPNASMMTQTDHQMMTLALKQAEQAASVDEVPVGAVITRYGRVIAEAHNMCELRHDATHHAEMLAMQKAVHSIGDWRLEQCTLYVTLEPCPMCAGAMINARLGRLVYGAKDPKKGAVDSLFQLLNDPRLNHRVPSTSGIMADKCSSILTAFFKKKRR